MQALSIEYSRLNYSSALISSGKKAAFEEKNPVLDRRKLPVGNNGLEAYNGDGMRIASERLEYNSLSITLLSKDGDSAIFNAAEAAGKAKNKAEENDLKDLIEYVKNTLVSVKAEILKGFVESNGGDFKEIEFDEKAVADLEAAMPEYWNAENTSQRIVDFATSFFSLSKMSVDDYMAMMKDAIDLGFGQAKGEMGELPGAVEGLVSKTHKLVMEKLQAWADSMKAPEQTATA